MRVKKAIFALAMTGASLMTCNTASAAVITKSYVFNAIFYTGSPLANVTANFTLNFDPAVVGSAKLISFSSTGAPYYNVPTSVSQFSTSQAQVGGTLNGAGTLLPSTNDFVISFMYDLDGRPLGGSSAGTLFSAAGDSRVYVSTSATLTEVTSAVPEISAWTMMMLGIGATGYSLRRRYKVTTRVQYA